MQFRFVTSDNRLLCNVINLITLSSSCRCHQHDAILMSKNRKKIDTFFSHVDAHRHDTILMSKNCKKIDMRNLFCNILIICGKNFYQ